MSDPTMRNDSAAEVRTDQNAERALPSPPSISNSVMMYWVLPVLLIATLSRFAVDTGPPDPIQAPPRPVSFNPKQGSSSQGSQPTNNNLYPSYDNSNSGNKPSKAPSAMPSFLNNKPTSYQEVVNAIGRRRLATSVRRYGDSEIYTSAGNEESQTRTNQQQTKPVTSSSRRDSTTTDSQSSFSRRDPPRGPSKDPVRNGMLDTINKLRRDSTANPDDLLMTIKFADAMRMYDVQYHDGGTFQDEVIATYQKAIEMATSKRNKMIEQGEETNVSLAGTSDLNDELTLEYSAKSIDGLLCSLYSGLGKAYFMANMFENAVQSYNRALEIEPSYLDAVSSRGSSRIILGLYEEAAKDFMFVIEKDTNRRFQDVFTGLARVLQTKENVVPGGWDPMIQVLRDLIPTIESQASSVENIPEAKGMLANTLNRFYHVMFVYHDSKTQDVDAAWDSLSKSYQYKMSALPAWNTGFESQKITATKQIFHRGFWPEGVGSDSSIPIFVIGFVRSGSTLLERVLDAHPKIAGMGENSVFNGQLDMIRNKIVEVSMLGDPDALATAIESLADGVIEEMTERWNMVAAAEDRASGRQPPSRFVDKMLTNYYNVGFIHMLFPNALILHVAREPMDTVFSAYKHEFPPGTLDYTSEFKSLTELYHAYRDVIEHWDRELPGRVTHIRYEDMVDDMPNVAKRIIQATGLEWDESVLDFHKKKHAVNTLSTTQVRKGVYRDSLQAWRKYERHLQPLVDLIGERTTYNLKTTLPPLESYEEDLSSSVDSDQPSSSVNKSAAGKPEGEL